MATNFEYYTWQDFNANNDVAPGPDGEEIINIQLLFHHVLEIYYPESNQIPLTTTRKSFLILRNDISSCDDQSRSSIIDDILSTTGVPRGFIDSILPEVSSFALETVRHPRNANVKVITIGIIICVTTPYDELEVIDRALSEIMQENARFEPGRKSCIEGLKRVRVVDGDGILEETCMVCLENELVGEEAIRLDCSHIFHGDCIVKWLETSHLCPLCRFSVS